MNGTINVGDNRGVVVGHSSGYVAAGNIYLGDYNVSQEALYAELTLKEVEPPEYVSPPQAAELVQQLADSQLLVLAGSRLNEGMIARHVAWLLRERLREAGQSICVREWLQSAGVQRLESVFSETDITVLLLPELSPHHLGYKLDRLTHLLRVRRGYAVVTTDSSPGDWGLAPGTAESRCWVALSWERLYGARFLGDFLVRELNHQSSWPEGLLPEGVAPNAPFVPGMSVLDLATKLQSPEAIRRFLYVLPTLDVPVSAEEVRARVDQLSNEREAVHRWYSRLDRKDQVLAMGLAMFNGLPDDQAFAGLEILVKSVWRPADPFLANFDYGDLSQLGSYFRFVDSSTGSWIEVPSERERDEVLRAVWKLQRRHLLATFPIITELIKGLATDDSPEDRTGKVRPPQSQNLSSSDASTPSPTNTSEPSLSWRADEAFARALFGTPRRRSQLQQAVISFLSRIAMLSTDAVESCFHELAVDGSASERRVVAQAIADWRKVGGSEMLFKLLHRWWREGCRLVYLGESSSSKILENRRQLSATRATVAMAVGYASLYDPPNQFHRSLLELLPSLLQDQDPLVRNSVLEVTLPLVVSQHLRQLQTFLRSRALCDEGLIHATGFGISLAYEQRPSEAAQVIDAWRGLAMNRSASSPKVPDREQLLAVVAYACGYLRCQSDQDLINPEQIFGTLSAVLAAEPHPLVRRSVLIALGLQAVNNFDVAASMIPPLVAEVTLEDRALIVAVLVRAYLSQRRQLQDGDETVEIGGVSYQAWTHRHRPLTAIEISLYAWMEGRAFPVTQQVTVQTFAAFAATELECQERELAARPRSEPSSTTSPYYTLAPRLRALSPLGWMSVFLAAPADEKARSTLGPLLAEVIEMQRSKLPVSPYRHFARLVTERKRPNLQSREAVVRNMPHVELLLYRWQVVTRQETRRIAAGLRTALKIYRWRWAIVIVSAWSAISLLQWLGELAR